MQVSIAERKEREKEHRRNDITNAAERLFFSNGYDRVSMDEIADAAEVSKGTLFVYFKNKESLFFAVVLRGARILNAMIEENTKSCKTSQDVLDVIASTYFDFVNRYPNYHRAYLYFRSGRFAIDDRVDVSEDAKEILRLRQETFVITCNAIKMGMKEGTIRADLDPEEVAILLMVIIKGITEMRPDLKKVLEGRRITEHQFFSDVADFVHCMLENKTKKDARV